MKEQKWVTAINQQGPYVLRLYITGASPNSIRAVENIKAFCEEYLPGNYQLEIIDVYQQPTIAEQEQIIALPLLIKKGPGVERRFVGDMSDTDKLLRNFNITNESKLPYDFDDIMALIAPRPVLIVQPKQDRDADPVAVSNAVNRAKKIYSLSGAENKLGLQEPDDYGRLTDATQNEAIKWMKNNF